MELKNDNVLFTLLNGGVRQTADGAKNGAPEQSRPLDKARGVRSDPFATELRRSAALMKKRDAPPVRQPCRDQGTHSPAPKQRMDTTVEKRADTAREENANVSEKRTDAVRNENRDASEFIDRLCQTTHPQIKKDAVAMIKEALLELGDHFGFSPVGLLEITDFDTAGQSDFLAEQFSEITTMLRSIVQALSESLQQSAPVEIKDKVLSPEESTHLQEALTKIAFKLKVGIELLGIAPQVLEKDAPKQNLPYPLSSREVPIAVSLESYESLTQEQFRRIMGKDQDPQTAIRDIISRIVAMTVQKGTEPQAPSCLAGIQEMCGLDPKIIRGLLKIDGPMEPVPTPREGQDRILSEGGAVQGKQQTPAPDMASTVTAATIGEKSAPEQKSTPQNQFQAGNGADLQMKTGAVQQNEPAKHVVVPIKGEESVLQQIARHVSLAAKEGAHEVRLVLRPETLGEVRMKIQVEGDVVMARITVENTQVKQIIENNFQSLRDALAEHNLHAGSFDVDVHRDTGGDHGAPDTVPNDDAGFQAEGSAGDEQAPIPVLGTETGRRFGLNSLEYFA